MNKKKVMIGVGVAVAALIVLYIGFSYFFMSHFYWNTTINGVSVGGVSVDEAKDRIEEELESYELSIVARDGSVELLSGTEFDMDIQWENEIENCIAGQNGFAWIAKMFSPDVYNETLGIVYDESALSAKIAGLLCMEEEKQIMPQNAYVAYTGDAFVVKEEVLGTAVDKQKLEQNIKSGITNLDAELLLEEDCYYEPEITVASGVYDAAVEQMNKALGTVITYEIGNNTEVLDASTFAEWLYVDGEAKVCVDEIALDNFVKDMGKKYNTAGSAKKLMTSYGVEVTIPNSHYGWKINNTEEKETIVAEIFAGEEVTRDLHYSMTAHSHDGPDYGNSYVEINLTAQHLYMYINGELIVETDFVSGNLANNWNTPTGAFSLTYKQKDATLRGADYVTPVSFWMPYFGNIGMHDATWRSEFGGNIYKTDGSHGCINLPWSKAKIIFENIETGFPVLCYELPGTEPVPAMVDPFAQFNWGF